MVLLAPPPSPFTTEVTEATEGTEPRCTTAPHQYEGTKDSKGTKEETTKSVVDSYDQSPLRGLRGLRASVVNLN